MIRNLFCSCKSKQIHSSWTAANLQTWQVYLKYSTLYLAWNVSNICTNPVLPTTYRACVLLTVSQQFWLFPHEGRNIPIPVAAPHGLYMYNSCSCFTASPPSMLRETKDHTNIWSMSSTGFSLKRHHIPGTFRMPYPPTTAEVIR